MKKTLTLIFAALFFYTINAQVVVNYQQVGTYTTADIAQLFPLVYHNGANAYRVEYKSPDVHGNPDTLSGIVVLPTDSEHIYPRLAYMHGTVADRESVASYMVGEYNLALVICGFGYAVAAPDYPGLGIGRGFHPYVHADSEGQSGVDLIRAMEEIAEIEGNFLNDQLFVTGYSQGGHGALGLHKLIEDTYSDEFTITASAPMSGPYSLTGVMLDFILEENEYNFAGYIPNTVLSMQTAYGNIYTELSEVFKPEYVGKIQEYYEEQIDLFELNDFLLAKLTELEGAPIPKFMLQESLIMALETNPDHPFLVALRDNDLDNWIPQAPTRMYYCTGDDQVPYQNSVVADSIMNALGAEDVEAVMVGGDNLDHGGCFNPALIATSAFLASYREIGTIVSSEDLVFPGIQISPNPAGDYIQLENASELNIREISIVNSVGQLEGRKIFRGEMIPIAEFSAGIKFIQLWDEKGNLVKTAKVVFE